VKKLYIYEADSIEYHTMEPYNFEDMDCELTLDEYEFIKWHEQSHKKYQKLLEGILRRNGK